MRSIASVTELAGRYDALLCDVWGVLRDAHGRYDGAAEVLAGLRAAGTTVVLLTNAPRPAGAVGDELRELGVPDDAWDAIVTSGDVTRTELARRSPGPVHRLGRDGDAALWDGLGLEFTALNRARFMAIAGLRGREEAPSDYLPVLRSARTRDLELVCANPDLVVPAGDALTWCAGAVAREYAALGGRVVQSGKPFAPMYERARAAIDRVAHRAVPRERILAIGDGIETDILGANRMGLDSLLVAAGINAVALLRGTEVDLDAAGRALDRVGARATYAITRLA